MTLAFKNYFILQNIRDDFYRIYRRKEPHSFKNENLHLKMFPSKYKVDDNSSIKCKQYSYYAAPCFEGLGKDFILCG